jgi:rhamnulokinase
LTVGARVFAAVDLGASSGRVVAGVLESDRIGLRQVERFPIAPVEQDGHLRWNLTRIYGHVVDGLRRIPDAESVGIDGWGVDYGILDQDGNLLAEPVAYRDGRTAEVVKDVHQVVSAGELYRITGTQVLPINTIYQIVAEQSGPLWHRAGHAVLVPDLVAYWLTGELGTEVTNASTTGLLNIADATWSTELFVRLGIPTDLFPPIETPGTRRGATDWGLPVVTVGSHDTASAVVGVPATTTHFAFISSGTWSLVGVELEEPVLAEEARRANFTNEQGVDGRIRFLRNVGGLWLLDECLREWAVEHGSPLLQEAARLARGGPLINPDDPTFIAPGGMPTRIAEAAKGPDAAMSPSAIVRCILDSLAMAYAHTLAQASSLANREIDVVHIVGGGSQNHLLCQLTADATGLPVLAGPTEATAFGNLVVQARNGGACPTSLEAMRACIAASVELAEYRPQRSSR